MILSDRTVLFADGCIAEVGRAEGIACLKGCQKSDSDRGYIGLSYSTCVFTVVLVPILWVGLLRFSSPRCGPTPAI